MKLNIDYYKIAMEIEKIKEDSRYWKAIIRRDFESERPVPELRIFRNYFNYEKAFRLIKRDTKVTTMQSILAKCKYD